MMMIPDHSLQMMIMILIYFLLRQGCPTMKTSSAKQENYTDTSSKSKIHSDLTIFQSIGRISKVDAAYIVKQN